MIFPFSTAATNTLLALILIFSLISGDLKRGFYILWRQQPAFTKIAVFYLALVAIGILWSNHRAFGLESLIHNGKWLVLPILLSVLTLSRKHYLYFMASLSLGFSLHLLVCLAQMFHLLDIAPIAGSNDQDATGYIGHISFGVTYAIWAGWLIFWGQYQRNRSYRYLAWALSAWSFIMIFLAQGRSGYLVSIAILLYICWQLFFKDKSWKRWFSIIIILIGIMITSAPELAKNTEIQGTLQSLQAMSHGHFETAELRGELWLSALDIWRENPWLGAGTGGYYGSVHQLADKYPRLVGADAKPLHLHPHQLYLLAAARWGVVGLLTICVLLWSWFRINHKQRNTYEMFAPLSALALAIHGLSSIGFEALHPITMGMFALAIAIASNAETPQEEV